MQQMRANDQQLTFRIFATAAATACNT